MRFQKLPLKLLGSELLQKVKNHLTNHQTKKVWILQRSLLTLKSSHVISPAQKSLSFLKYREKNHTNHCQFHSECQSLAIDHSDCPTLEHEAFLCQSFDFFLFSWLLKREKGFLSKGSRAETAPLPCENHARKMRTFFARRLEPKTRSSYHIKWSNAKWNTLKQNTSSLLKTKLS